MNDEPLPVLLRRYEAFSYASALDAYGADLLQMAEGGDVPVATCRGWDPEGTAAALIGGSSWKPGPGTLAVTFRRDAAAAAR